MKRYLLASAVMFALVPFNAQAAQIDAAGAARLKEYFSKYLKNQEEMNEAGGDLDVVYTGDVSVEPKGEYYAVILPKVVLKPGENLKKAMNPPPAPGQPPAPEPSEALGFTLDLGQTALNAIPDDKPGYWKMTVALPGTMSINVPNEFSANLSIGEQNTAGLFHEVSGNFLKLNSVLKNVKINAMSGGEASEFNIPEITMNANLEEETPGYVTGPSLVRISGLGFDIPNQGGRIDLGAIQVMANLTRYRLMPIEEYKEKTLTFIQKMKGIEDAALAGQPPSAQTIDEIVNAILAMCDFEGFNFAYSLENLSVQAKQAQGIGEFNNFKLGAASFGFGMEGLKSEHSALNMKLGYSGIAMDPVPPGYEGVIPDAVNVDLSAGKIPLQAMWTSSLNAGKAIAQNPDAGIMAAMGLMMQLPMMLTQAGTEITVKDNYVSAADYKASLNGLVKADPAAVMQFVADLKGRFDGLDELLARVKAKAADPNFPNAYEFNDMASQLESLRQYGQAAAGPDGKAGYDFDIKVTADGKTIVNGQDIPMGPPAGGPDEQDPAAGGAEQPLPY